MTWSGASRVLLGLGCSRGQQQQHHEVLGVLHPAQHHHDRQEPSRGVATPRAQPRRIQRAVSGRRKNQEHAGAHQVIGIYGRGVDI